MTRWFAALLALSFNLLPVAARAGEANGKTEITWYGQAAFLVKTPKGTVLAIDPWLSNPVNPDKEAAAKITKLDFILITHGHFDHVGDAVDLAKRTGAKLVASGDLGSTLVAGAGFPKDQATFATVGNVGGTIPLTDEVQVLIVPAVHSSNFAREGEGGPMPGGNPVGFVVKIAGGPTLYHTGDTDVFSDMKLIGERQPIDLMLGCIGGHFTMDPAGAALAASFVKPKQFVPMHFGTFPILNGTPAQLAKEFKARGVKSAIVEFKPGETRAF
jgi:L-ascorbate metabolism protein UlaG (beta-lactamase superfamily)